MNTPEFILKALFFIVNGFAICFIVWYVSKTVKCMEYKLDNAIRFMHWVKQRHDSTYIYALCRLQEALVKLERYEEAAKVKKIIDEELKQLDEEEKKKS